jgi:hypothetical protein
LLCVIVCYLVDIEKVRLRPLDEGTVMSLAEMAAQAKAALDDRVKLEAGKPHVYVAFRVSSLAGSEPMKLASEVVTEAVNELVNALLATGLLINGIFRHWPKSPENDGRYTVIVEVYFGHEQITTFIEQHAVKPYPEVVDETISVSTRRRSSDI